jgi:hypothetical protein
MIRVLYGGVSKDSIVVVEADLLLDNVYISELNGLG